MAKDFELKPNGGEGIVFSSCSPDFKKPVMGLVATTAIQQMVDFVPDNLVVPEKVVGLAAAEQRTLTAIREIRELSRRSNCDGLRCRNAGPRR